MTALSLPSQHSATHKLPASLSKQGQQANGATRANRNLLYLFTYGNNDVEVNQNQATLLHNTE